MSDDHEEARAATHKRTRTENRAETHAVDEVELTLVTMTFDAADDATLLAILSKYVVLTRMQDGCRNVDLCSSVTRPGRHLIVQKWETPQHQRVHFDSDVMVDMASACVGVLSNAPDIDLWDATSAHDLR